MFFVHTKNVIFDRNSLLADIIFIILGDQIEFNDSDKTRKIVGNVKHFVVVACFACKLTSHWNIKTKCKEKDKKKNSFHHDERVWFCLNVHHIAWLWRHLNQLIDFLSNYLLVEMFKIDFRKKSIRICLMFVIWHSFPSDFFFFQVGFNSINST